MKDYSMSDVNMSAAAFITDNIFASPARVNTRPAGTVVTSPEAANKPVDKNAVTPAAGQESPIPMGLIATVAVVIAAGWLAGRK